jgi:hypothetical protein
MPTDRSQTDVENSLTLEVQTLKDELAHQRAGVSATVEVLKVIQDSSSDIQSVFDAILKRSGQLCEAPTVSLVLLDDAREHLVLTAQWGEPLEH